jgi:polysaccharide biosynthesis transport protein
MMRRFLREWRTLTPAEHLYAVRRYRWFVVVLALLGTVGAIGFSLTREPLYRSSVQMVVAPNLSNRNAAEAAAASNYVLQRARTYRKVVASEEVTAAVIARLGLPYTARELTERITVLSESNTTVLTVEVLDPSAVRARDIANAIGVAFPAYVERLETPAGTTLPPVVVSVARPAETPDGPAYPRTPLNGVLGLLVGLGMGLSSAVFRYAADPRVRGPRHAASVVGSVALGPDVVAGLRQQSGDLTSIVVTGPVDDASRRAATADLAVALARAGETVVLVDADPRNPAMASLFGAPDEVGLTTVLADEVPAIEAAARWRHPELPLFLLPVGPGADTLNLTEVRRGGRLAKVVQALQAADTVVIVAAPTPDALLTATTADAVILLAREGETPVDALAAAAKLANPTPLLGVLLVP